jgi:hypothetical protein
VKRAYNKRMAQKAKKPKPPKSFKALDMHPKPPKQKFSRVTHKPMAKKNAAANDYPEF